MITGLFTANDGFTSKTQPLWTYLENSGLAGASGIKAGY